MGIGKFVVKPAKNGFKFSLKAGNGEVIASSEVYSGEAACLKGVESVRAASAGSVEDQTLPEPVALKHPKFELYRDKAGEFRFRLKAKNGEIVATSEGYKAKASCVKGIESVKRNAASAEVVKES